MSDTEEPAWESYAKALIAESVAAHGVVPSKLLIDEAFEKAREHWEARVHAAAPIATRIMRDTKP